MKNIDLKEIKKYSDLYGWDITVIQLKKKFNSVSWARNSKPTEGSLTLPTRLLNENEDTVINKVIVHKNKTITMATNQGWLTFLNL